MADGPAKGKDVTEARQADIVEWWAIFDSYVTEWTARTRQRLRDDWQRLFEEAVAHQEGLILAGVWRSGPRSLLGVIRQRHLEEVHSAVLAWLLDPNAQHGLGGSFLDRFLARTGLRGEQADPHVRVVTEESCTHPEVESWGYTDIVVRGPSWTLVIENKLWAAQSGDQLDFYYDAYAAEGAVFVYLTPEGTRPRSTRPEVIRAFHPVSWRRQVLPDLVAAIAAAEAAGEPCGAAREYVAALEEEIR